MTEDPIKIHLNSSTYVTKVNGKLVVVHERRERLRDICLDLLGEAFGKFSRPKMKDESKKPDGENVPIQNPTAKSSQHFPTPQLFNPNANLVGPAPVQPITGPMGPQPGLYKFGNRQLALLPLNPQGGPAIPPQMGHPYSQPTWIFPQTSNMSGFNFPLNGIDPRQFIQNPAAPSNVTSQTSATVTKHVCAECGRLRSRKYQLENQLKPGETPSPAFCKKCQKDVTSTEESDTSIRNTEKQHKLSRKGRKKKAKVKGDTDSSKESVGSNALWKGSKPKQKQSRNQLLDGDIAREGQQAKSNHRSMRIHLHEDEDYIPSRKEASPVLDKVHLRCSRSISPLQGREIYPPAHQSCTNHQAQRWSRECVVTNAAEAFHHSRRALSRSTYEACETDRISKQSCSNEDSASSEATPHGVHSFEDPIISTSRTRSEEASRRRRLERSTDHQGFHREATGLPHGIHPSKDDDVVVVTERYIIRRRSPPHAQRKNLESHRRDIMDKAVGGVEKPYPRFTAEAGASDYYRNDWARVGEHNRAGHERVRPRDLEGLISPANSHTSDTSSTSRYRARTDDHYPPSAPSPLNSLHQGGGLRAQVDSSRHDVSYPPSEDESLPLRENKKYTTPDREVATRGRSSNTYRPPYVREATDRGTERALMPSPKLSHEKLFYPDTNESEITEEIERVERHVTFRDPEEYEGYDILSGKIDSARILREPGGR